MEIEIDERAFLGKEFRNQYEIFDALIFYFFGLLADEVRLLEDAEDYLKVEVGCRERKFEIISFYLNDFAIITTDNDQMNLKVDQFILPFHRKVYRVSNESKFSKLLNLSIIKRLFTVLKRIFTNQNYIFQKLPRVLIPEILSFLDLKTVSNMMLGCRELRKQIDYAELWRDLYYSRYGKCNFVLKELNWKKIYIKSAHKS